MYDQSAYKQNGYSKSILNYRTNQRHSKMFLDESEIQNKYNGIIQHIQSPIILPIMTGVSLSIEMENESYTERLISLLIPLYYQDLLFRTAFFKIISQGLASSYMTHIENIFEL